MTNEDKKTINKIEKKVAEEIEKLDKIFKSDATNNENYNLYEEKIILKSFLIECKKVNEFYKNN